MSRLSTIHAVEVTAAEVKEQMLKIVGVLLITALILMAVCVFLKYLVQKMCQKRLLHGRERRRRQAAEMLAVSMDLLTRVLPVGAPAAMMAGRAVEVNAVKL